MLLVETNFNTNILFEGEGDSEKKMYIEGIFLQADIVNKNRRIYPKEIMETAVMEYQVNAIDRNTAIGELDHPPTLGINSDRIACKIVKIEEDGSNFRGKALLLPTPMGNIARTLIESGIQMGVSSRAGGAVKRNSLGIDEVQSGLKFVAIDIVSQPSAPDAYVQGVMESGSAFWNTIEECADANLIEDYRKSMQKMTVKELNERKFELYQTFINTLTGKL